MPKLNLQKREKMVVAVGVALALILVFRFVAQKPLNEYRKADIAARAATERLDQARLMRDQVLAERSAQKDLQRVVGGRGQGDLTTFVNRQLSQAGLLKDRATWKNSSKFADSSIFEQLDVTLTGVTLEEVVNFLHGIYNGGNVIVAHSMRVEPANSGTGLTCRIVLLSPKV